MTWSEMHIGLDLGLQILNSNLFNKLEPQAKDYFINRVMYDMISKEVNIESKTAANLQSYNDIREYSSLLEPILIIQQLDKYTGDGTYDYVTLPKDVSPVISGFLYMGRTYKVVIAGTSNLTTFGAASSPAVVGATFTCNIATINATSLTIGCKYRILTVSGSTYTSVGSINNMVGTEFIATGTSAGGVGIVTPLSGLPTWAGGTSLTMIPLYSVLEVISSYSNIDKGSSFSTGPLKKGTKYKVVTGGTISNLTSFGSAYNAVEPGYVFLCTLDGTPNWSTSGVVLIATKDILNRLVKLQDIANFSQTSYGNTDISPLSTMSDGKLLVYHNGKYTINSITLVYVRQPNKIDSQNNVDCELLESYHGKLVDNTVQFIMAYSGNPNYQTVLTENTKK